MKRLSTLLIVLVACVYATACTNFIVGKGASADGSVFTTYNADDYGMFIGLCHFPAGKHAKGEMRQIYDWDTKEYHGQIPEAGETYNVIGNINEYQVSIGETTFGGRHEMVDTTGVLDYGSLIYIALQRSKTAREAIKVMTTLAETYGYCSEGETFSICDPEEAWIMEMMGKGPGSKGVVWVALRIPDDAICAHANQSRIRKFDQKDKKNVMFSKDCISFAREKGWFNGKDEDFGRPVKFMKKQISPQGPYYLVEQKPRFATTMGSVVVDTSLHVLGKDGQPIPNLYAAGEIANAVHGDDSSPGANVGWGITSGKAVSDVIVKELNRK